MSATYYFFSPLSREEIEQLEEECNATLAGYLEEHGESGEDLGTVAASDFIPTVEDAQKAYAELGNTLPDALARRLSETKSAIAIERPAAFELNPLQVSVARFLLERIGKGLVLYNDYPLQLAKVALLELRAHDQARDFGGPAPRDMPAMPDLAALLGGGRSRRKEKPKRSKRALDMLEKAREDPELSIDVRASLMAVSDDARNYGALLFEQGAIDDDVAARELGIDEGDVAAVADELIAALERAFK